MSVATLLGLDEPGAGLLEVARMRWPAWQERHAVLRTVDDLADLKGATRRLGSAGSNEILLALAELGMPDGGNEAAATATLVWLLLPGAGHMAGRLQRELPELREEVDQLVAGQVWIQARTLKIGPSRPTNCAATVLRNAERCIRRELGMHERSDKTRRRSILIGAGSDCEDKTGMLLGAPSPTLPAEVELRDLFDAAINAGEISTVDAQLLLEVAARADEVSSGGPGRRGGLMSEAVSVAVAQRRGGSPRSVRRRTHAAITKLRAYNERSMGRSA